MMPWLKQRALVDRDRSRKTRPVPGFPKELRAPATVGGGCIVHYGKFGGPMSALGQKQTFPHVHFMSALSPKADMDRWPRRTLLPANGRYDARDFFYYLPLFLNCSLWVARLK
jgi:hypothetical protein